MKIRIRNPLKTPFWGIPEAKIHLVAITDDGKVIDNLEFESINPDELTLYQKQTLWSAIKFNIIEAQDDKDFQIAFLKLVEEYLDKRKKKEVQTFGEIEVDNKSKEKDKSSGLALANVKKAESFKKVLCSSISTLKKELSEYSALDLELFRKIELLGKNRKTVLKLIDVLIGNQVKENIVKDTNPNAPSAEEYQKRQIYRGLGGGYLQNVSPVVESKEKAKPITS